MSGTHHHIPKGINKERALLAPLILTATYFLVEVISGVITGSLALISDAAHMLSDVIALAIAFAAMKIGKKAPDDNRTFGYERFEILAAAFNTILLFIIAFYILYEAYLRISKPPEIQSVGMLIVASIGLLVNLISMRLLHAGKDESLNLKGAYLEVWSDALGSLGVIIGALCIHFFHWTWIDSIVAVLIGFWILPRTWILLKATMNILLEGVPPGIDIKAIRSELLQFQAVEDIHELHVWGISNQKVSLTAHVVVNEKVSHEKLISDINARLGTAFNIHHTTLQIEYKKCIDESEDCHFHQ